jgi:hypothetical protein
MSPTLRSSRSGIASGIAALTVWRLPSATLSLFLSRKPLTDLIALRRCELPLRLCRLFIQ